MCGQARGYCAYGDHVLYNQIIDAWSMRNWPEGGESGHDHFFATFDKFGLTSHNHTAESVATVINRAGREHVQYIEFMHTADGGAAPELGLKLGWESDFAKMRDKLLAGGLKDIVAATSNSRRRRCPSPHRTEMRPARRRAGMRRCSPLYLSSAARITA